MKKIDKVLVIGGEGTATNIADAISDARTNYNLNIEFIGCANDNFGTKPDLQGYPIVCVFYILSYSILNINKNHDTYNIIND